MQMNYSDIKQELKDNWEQLADNPYATDLVNEFAESAIPIYYSEIIKDWQEMPHEYNDTWSIISDVRTFLFDDFSIASAKTFNKTSESEFVLICLKSCLNISPFNFSELVKLPLCPKTNP